MLYSHKSALLSHTTMHVSLSHWVFTLPSCCFLYENGYRYTRKTHILLWNLSLCFQSQLVCRFVIFSRPENRCLISWLPSYFYSQSEQIKRLDLLTQVIFPRFGKKCEKILWRGFCQDGLHDDKSRFEWHPFWVIMHVPPLPTTSKRTAPHSVFHLCENRRQKRRMGQNKLPMHLRDISGKGNKWIIQALSCCAATWGFLLSCTTLQAAATSATECQGAV